MFKQHFSTFDKVDFYEVKGIVFILIFFLKEKIFEELMNAKLVINETKAENAAYKTKTQNLEKQMQKYEKIIEELH